MRRWVLSISSGLSGYALLVAGFVRDRPFALCGSLGSFGLFWIVQVRPVGLLVRYGLLGSSGYALVVAGFVLVRLVRPCALWGSLDSFVLVWLVRLRALGVAGFDWVDLVRLGAPLGSLGLFGCAPGSLDS